MKNKGITLVALVVTIVIMLILAGVTLNLAIGDRGIFHMAQKAVNAYEQSAKNEALGMEGVEKYLSELESDTPTPPTPPTPEDEKPDRSQLNIGNEVDYTPEPEQDTYTLEGSVSGYAENGTAKKQNITKGDYEWKILNIDNTTSTVDIIGVPTTNMQDVYFQGATGYNNGVWALNDICAQLYSNTTLGVQARSINIEDIEKHFSDIGKNKKEESISRSKRDAPYTDPNNYYPILAKFEDHVGVDSTITGVGKIGESDDGTSLGGQEINIPLKETDLTTYNNSKEKANTNLYVKQTYYTMVPIATYYVDYVESSTSLYFYDLIFKTNTNYWLASRYSFCDSVHANFGLRSIHINSITGDYLFHSDDNTDQIQNHLKIAPVVSLGSDIQFSQNNDGSWKPSKIEEN